MYEDPAVLDQYLLFHYGRREQICPSPLVPAGWNFPADCAELLLRHRPTPRPRPRPRLRGRTQRLRTRPCRRRSRRHRLLPRLHRRRQPPPPARPPPPPHPRRSRSPSHGDRRTRSRHHAATRHVRTRRRLRPAARPRDFRRRPPRQPRRPVARPPRLPRSTARARPAGGVVLVTSPYTWLPEFTPPERWLGAGRGDSFAGLREALAPDFELTHRQDLPFLIREHARKFQWSSPTPRYGPGLRNRTLARRQQRRELGPALPRPRLSLGQGRAAPGPGRTARRHLARTTRPRSRLRGSGHDVRAIVGRRRPGPPASTSRPAPVELARAHPPAGSETYAAPPTCSTFRRSTAAPTTSSGNTPASAPSTRRSARPTPRPSTTPSNPAGPASSVSTSASTPTPVKGRPSAPPSTPSAPRSRRGVRITAERRPVPSTLPRRHRNAPPSFADHPRTPD